MSGALPRCAGKTEPEPRTMDETAELILHRGLFTTLDRARPTASAVAIKDGRFLRVGQDHEVMALAGAEHAGDRPARPPRAAGPDRRPSAHHPWRAQLQPRTALGRRAQPGRRDGHAQAPGRGDAGAAMGAGGGRLHRAPVRREAAADDRGAERRRAGHAGLPAAPVRPRAAQRRGPARRRLHARHARAARRRDRARRQRQPDRPAAGQAECVHPLRGRWPGARSCPTSTSSIRPATSCAS